MALINEHGNYLKIEKLSFEKLTYTIYKSEEVRKNVTEYDNVITNEIEINADQIGAMEIIKPTVYDVVITAGYEYLKTLPMFEGWESA